MEFLQELGETVSVLTGALDIHSVDAARAMLLEHLHENARVTLDLSSVRSCDAAGAQLLLALEKSAGSAGKPMIILAASDQFTHDCANLGIHLAAVLDSVDPAGKPRTLETKRTRGAAKRKTKGTVSGVDA